MPVLEGVPPPVHGVLQTYTVPLAQVRRDLPLWIPALKNEMTSLESTTRTVRPVKVADLIKEEGNEMLVAPAKVVPTVKAPDAWKKARIVLYGNLIEDTSQSSKQKVLEVEKNLGEGRPLPRASGKTFELY